MEKQNTLNRLPLLLLILGLLGLGLRSALLASAVDEKGLLVSGHPLAIVLWLLTAAAAVCAVLSVKKAPVEFPRGICAALSAAVFGIALVWQILSISSTGFRFLFLAHQVLGAAAAVSALALAFFHWKGAKPFFGCYAMICLFCAIHLVLSYQLWSENPQMQDYVFSLGSVLTLMLFAYRQAAALAGMKPGKGTAALGLLGLYFSCCAIPGGDFPLLYGAAALFLMGQQMTLSEKGVG